MKIDLGATLDEEIYYGNSLGLFHSYNQWVKQQLYAVTSSTPGIPSGSIINPNDVNNYFMFNFSESEVNNYEDFRQPFLIEVGDEIRVTYDIDLNATTVPTYVTQDFTVTSIVDEAPGKTLTISYTDPNDGSSAIAIVTGKHM